MADDIVDSAKKSGLQKLVDFMSNLLSPLTGSTQKGLRAEYLKALGIEDKDLKQTDTSKIDSYLKKEADEADTLAFLEATKQLTEVVANIKDFIESETSGSFDKKRLINDTTTTLLNILTLEYFRLKMPLLHNIFM